MTWITIQSTLGTPHSRRVSEIGNRQEQLLRPCHVVSKDVRAIGNQPDRIYDDLRSNAHGDEGLFRETGLQQEGETQRALITRKAAEESRQHPTEQQLSP